MSNNIISDNRNCPKWTNAENNNMPTHKSYCVYCGNNTYCTNPASLLDIQGTCNDTTWPPIAFCSIECFNDLKFAMKDVWDHAQNLANEPDNWEARELFGIKDQNCL